MYYQKESCCLMGWKVDNSSALRRRVRMDTQKKRTIEARLKEQRQELIKKRLGIEESLQNLQTNEIEFEEKATNEYLAAGLHQLDNQDKNTIEAIDYALGRIQSDQYDICESCGEKISEKRLEAVPWTTRCIDCAAELEENRKPEFPIPKMEPEIETETELETELETDLPLELEGLNDDELELAVADALHEDGTIQTEELIISCRDKKLLLSGLLPNKRHHSHLMQIVYDELGFRDVEDAIKIDPLPWQRNHRTPGIETEKIVEDDSIEGGGIETIEAIKEGKTMVPADEIIPEKRRGSKT
jgi:RNA polymerase-binding protein DksA